MPAFNTARIHHGQFNFDPEPATEALKFHVDRRTQLRHRLSTEADGNENQVERVGRMPSIAADTDSPFAAKVMKGGLNEDVRRSPRD